METASIHQWNEWINKLWYINTVVYYPDIKRSEVLLPAMAWMNLKSIMQKKKKKEEEGEEARHKRSHIV